MSEAVKPTYTPGPWRVKKRETTLSVYGAGRWPSKPVATIARKDAYNARLIASAPELLDALKLALPFVAAVYREHGRDYLPNSGDAQERIQAVIAKADGDA
jgi:hypothetical protein